MPRPEPMSAPFWILSAGAALALVGATNATAADLSAEMALVSDYRYRGVSLSNGHPALQATVTVEHDSGLYLELWGSSIDEPRSDPAAEIDLMAGYDVDLAEGLSLDVSGTYYLYPSDSASNYVEAAAILSAAHGQASASLGLSWVPRQAVTRDEAGRHANFYSYGELSYELDNAPLMLCARLGYERGHFDEVDQGGKWDWMLGADLALDKATFGLAYVGSTAELDHRHAITASLRLAF